MLVVMWVIYMSDWVSYHINIIIVLWNYIIIKYSYYLSASLKSWKWYRTNCKSHKVYEYFPRWSKFYVFYYRHYWKTIHSCLLVYSLQFFGYLRIKKFLKQKTRPSKRFWHSSGIPTAGEKDDVFIILDFRFLFEWHLCVQSPWPHKFSCLFTRPFALHYSVMIANKTQLIEIEQNKLLLY